MLTTASTVKSKTDIVLQVVAVGLAVLIVILALGLIVTGLRLDQRLDQREGDAQECVDQGGTPFVPSRWADVNCLHPGS